MGALWKLVIENFVVPDRYKTLFSSNDSNSYPGRRDLRVASCSSCISTCRRCSRQTGDNWTCRRTGGMPSASCHLKSNIIIYNAVSVFGAHFTKLIPIFNLEQQNRSLLTKVLDKDYPVKINVNSRGESVWRELLTRITNLKFQF